MMGTRYVASSLSSTCSECLGMLMVYISSFCLNTESDMWLFPPRTGGTQVCACVQWRSVHALNVFKPQLKNERQKTGRFLLIFQAGFKMWHSEGSLPLFTDEDESLPPHLAPHTSLTHLLTPIQNNTGKEKTKLELIHCGNPVLCRHTTCAQWLFFVGTNDQESGTLAHIIRL